MRSYTKTNPKFSDTIQITETSDPAHADVINAAPMQLLQNTIVNRQEIGQLEEPDFEEPQEEIDPEDAINQICPKKHQRLLYKYIKAALRGIFAIAKKALNIATGKNQARVFATVADLDAWLAVPDNVKKLNVGDNFYIVATDVPDYWWDGTTKQKLEVQKIDLTTYDNAIKALQKEDEELKQSVKLEALSTNNIIDVLTTINQITSIGFWKINSIDGDYAQSIGIRPADNVGDFYAIVSNYNGDGVNHFAYGNLQLFSPRLGVNYFAIQVWDENATARCMITHDNLLNTTEQISANTESFYAAGAFAAKEMMADYNAKINQINSNMGVWIDVLSTANVYIPISTGKYCSYLRYNTYTKQIVGVLCTTSDANVPNQSKILTFAQYLDEIKSLTGLCGICNYASDGMLVTPRIENGSIISSHSKQLNATGEFAYLIDFVIV